MPQCDVKRSSALAFKISRAVRDVSILESPHPSGLPPPLFPCHLDVDSTNELSTVRLPLVFVASLVELHDVYPLAFPIFR